MDIGGIPFMDDVPRSPNRILAVPEVPVGIPSQLLQAGLRVADKDEILVGIAAEIAVGILELHQTVAFFSDEGKKFLILKIVGDARGGQHLLAPELAAPESTDLGDIVIAELKRLARLVKHLFAHEGINETARDEAVHLRAKPPFEPHVPESRPAHHVRNGGRGIHGCKRDRSENGNGYAMRIHT